MKNELRPYNEYCNIAINYIEEYPAHWNITKFRSVLEERKEKNINSKQNNILSVVKNIGVIPYNEKGNVGNKHSEDIERYKLVFQDDIVMNSMNVIIGSVGRSKYDGALSPVYYVLKNRNYSEFNTKYYEYIFKMLSFQRELTKYGKGILAHRMRIPMELLKNLELLKPPRDEQDQIVKYLDYKLAKINKLIKAKKKLITVLREQKQAIITDAVTKGLNDNEKIKFSGYAFIGNIPDDWQVLRFSRVAKVKSNLVNPADYPIYYQVSPENIEKNSGRLLVCKTVRDSGIISSNHLFKRGQILYSKVRPKLNKVTIAPFDGLCSADMYPIETNLETEYLLYYMLSNTFLLQLAITENRVKMPKINKEELSAIMITVPPLNVQKDIVNYIKDKGNQIAEAIIQIEREIQLVEEYKNSLISNVVTGKVDIRNFEILEIENDFEDEIDLNDDDENEESDDFIDEGGDE
jgi:type I restriction enzyme S subunit